MLTRDLKIAVAAACLLLFAINLIIGFQGSSSPNFQPSNFQKNLIDTKSPKPFVIPKDKFKAKPKKVTAFKEPKLAAKLLKLLDKNYRAVGYCGNVLDYLVMQSPKEIYDIDFFTNYPKMMPLVKSMKKIGDVTVSTKQKKKKYTEKTSIFFKMYKHDPERQVFACPHQLTNHVLGNSQLGNKDTVAEIHQNYSAKFQNKTHCLKKFMPDTFILEKPDQCRAFFNILNSEIYNQTKQVKHILYMEKLASGREAHSANGVKPFDSVREDRLRQVYQNGSLCGNISENTIMQEYISNPQLLEGHKFDMRVHLFIASTQPLIAYYYNGYFRVSLEMFDANSSDLNIHLSNNHAEKPANMTKHEKNRLKTLNMKDLQKFLIAQNVTQDENWIETGLRQQIQRAMSHLVNSAKGDFQQKPNSYEIYGCDFLLDTNLSIWFMECQTDPNYSNLAAPQLVKDHFDIVINLLKSRIKRAVAFVNKLTKQVKKEGIDSKDKAKLKAFAKKYKDKYKEINENYFDKEFHPKKKNGFVKVIDQQAEGIERFGNLFPADCLDVLNQ
jgi:hypothetical protein